MRQYTLHLTGTQVKYFNTLDVKWAQRAFTSFGAKLHGPDSKRLQVALL